MTVAHLPQLKSWLYLWIIISSRWRKVWTSRPSGPHTTPNPYISVFIGRYIVFQRTKSKATTRQNSGSHGPIARLPVTPYRRQCRKLIGEPSSLLTGSRNPHIDWLQTCHTREFYDRRVLHWNLWLSVLEAIYATRPRHVRHHVWTTRVAVSWPVTR